MFRIGTISASVILPGKWKTDREKGIVNKTTYDRSNNCRTVFRILAFTLSQPGALLDGRLNDLLHIARRDGLKRKQGSTILTRVANRFTRLNSLCASKDQIGEIVFFNKIRGFQSCHFPTLA